MEGQRMAKCLREGGCQPGPLGATRRVGRLPRSDVGTRSRALRPTGSRTLRCAGDLCRTGSKACNRDCLRERKYGDRKPAASTVDTGKAVSRAAQSSRRLVVGCRRQKGDVPHPLYIGKSASKPIGNDWPTCNFCPEFPCSDNEQSDTSDISRDITV